MAAGRRAAPCGCGRRRRARGCHADRRDRAAARGHRRIRGQRRPRPVGRCPIWHCRVGPRPQPVGGPPPARPGSRQARSGAACSRRRWCWGWSSRAPRSRSYGAGAVFGKRRAGWRNRMTGVWLRRAAPKRRQPERHCTRLGRGCGCGRPGAGAGGRVAVGATVTKQKSSQVWISNPRSNSFIRSSRWMLPSKQS